MGLYNIFKTIEYHIYYWIYIPNHILNDKIRLAHYDFIDLYNNAKNAKIIKDEINSAVQKYCDKMNDVNSTIEDKIYYKVSIEFSDIIHKLTNSYEPSELATPNVENVLFTIFPKSDIRLDNVNRNKAVVNLIINININNYIII